MQARGITGKDLTDLLNHNLFRKLYGNMQRSVTTALQGDHYTYGVKTDDGYAAVKGQYKSKYLIGLNNKVSLINLFLQHLIRCKILFLTPAL